MSRFPTKAERDAMLADAIQVLVAMILRERQPDSKLMGRAVTAAVNLSALRSRGSVREAAPLVNAKPSTFHNQLRRGLSELCKYLPMHGPLDDALFPFIRIHWQSSDLGFVSEYESWLRDVIQPRAHSESTKVISLQNYTGFSGNPTDEYVNAMAAMAGSVTDLDVFRGVVIFAPTHPNMMSLLNPVNSAKGEQPKIDYVRFTTQADQALNFAAQLFAAAQVPVPNLSLD